MNIQIFDFSEQPVRVLTRDGEPWFVAADVCRVLEHTNPTMALDGLDEDERMTLSNAEGHSGQRGGAQSFNIISESGLYALVFKSRKPEAKKFRKWVTSEVLPAIRQTGRYEMPAAEGLTDQVSILAFVQEVCGGWGLDKQIEFGMMARRYAKAMGVVFAVAKRPGMGAVFVFPRPVLEDVRRSFARREELPDVEAAEFERLLEALHSASGDGRHEPDAVRSLAKTLGLFPRIFGADTNGESERREFAALASRYHGRVFPSGYVLTNFRAAGGTMLHEVRRTRAHMMSMAG